MIEGWVMKKTWNRDSSPKRREGNTFVTHPCIDCLRMVRWEGYRCFDCEASFRAARSAYLSTEGDRTCQVCGSFLEKISKHGLSCPRCRTAPGRKYRS